VTGKAELDAINLAAPLVDAVQVLVPRKGSTPRRQPSGLVSPASPAGSPLVNINTASLAELDALPGVGPSTAKAILETREKRGSFSSVDDLLDVPGIGPAKLAQIRDLVTW
jgi:competence protein ComEA